MLKNLLIAAVAVALGAAGVYFYQHPGPLDEPAFVGMQVQGMSDDVAKALGRPDAGGVLVRDVALGGPSDRAGFMRGDIIVRFDGVPIDTFDTMLRVVGKTKARAEVEALLIRNGQEKTVTMTTGQWSPEWRISQEATGTIAPAGLTVMALTDDVRKRFSLPWGALGVVVSKIEPEMVTRTDLQVGELIVQVNQRPVWQPSQMQEEIKSAGDGKRQKVLLLVQGVRGFRFSLLPIE